MSMKLLVGPEAIANYKRLAYQPWYAIAELIDNSTQSYFNNMNALKGAFKEDKKRLGHDVQLTVRADYERDDDLLRIWDNAMGMDFQEVQNALTVAKPPANTKGRSKYGMGLKTSACWLGNQWTIKTTKLGEQKEYVVKVDVMKLAQGKDDLDLKITDNKMAEEHYTIVEIQQLNRQFQGRTLGKIREYLRSMYRHDLKSGTLNLEWRGEKLEWEGEALSNFVTAESGKAFRKKLAFEVDGKPVTGWAGVLKNGGRSKAGFAILCYNRVICCQPDNAWRPGNIYGDARNDLINQRLTGEIHLDEFEMSHTKDDIAWEGNQEEEIETKLANELTDYIHEARTPHKDREGGGPSEIEKKTVIEDLRREMESPEFIDELQFEALPPEEEITENSEKIAEDTDDGKVDLPARIVLSQNEILRIKGYIRKLSPNDPYVAIKATQANEVIVTINQSHPHWSEIRGADGLHNFLKHCIYDGVSEWKARRVETKLKPATIKTIKDRLLRVRLEMIESGDFDEAAL